MTKHPVVINGVVRWRDTKSGMPVTPHLSVPTSTHEILLREVIGEVLRNVRTRKGGTLREISQKARVSLGYLSEVERGKKEPSSELLAAICSAMRVPLFTILREVADRLEMNQVPDALPADFDSSLSPL